ncbi:MAG: protein jag [Bacteroides sp.]|nr:protein jag [Prevotella sp.]MCM1408820.1 protein jag [Treponema brennaborense]MCM1470600.1 protein jag [Bacteroides sp.]
MIYEYEAKNEKEAIELAAAELGLEKDQFDVEILETQKTSLFKKGYVKIRVHVDDSMKKTEESPKQDKTITDRLPQDDFEKQLVDFISTVIKKMGYQVSVEIMFREEYKKGIRLNSSHSSILIGKKGKNLDALQLLANVFAGKLGHENTRIILDTQNYRIRREEALVRLAYVTADKVRTTRNSILLEPMNPFERRLIHTTLNDISDIETKSEGDGLYKQVRVFYKGVL